jgi:hypothetical protein
VTLDNTTPLSEINYAGINSGARETAFDVSWFLPEVLAGAVVFGVSIVVALGFYKKRKKFSYKPICCLSGY